MLLTLKNLQQQTFTMDIDPDITVKKLKERIEEEKGVTAYPVSSQKLIYAGKVMGDEDPISKYSIDEKKFVVVMVTKARIAVQTTTPVAKEVENKETKKEEKNELVPKIAEKESEIKKDSSEKEADTKSEDQQKEEPKVDTSSETGTSTQEIGSGMVVGNDYDKMVQNIVDMGYEKVQVVSALKASFNNPERAIEYLISGIPSLQEMGEAMSDVPSQLFPLEPSQQESTQSNTSAPSIPSLFPSTTAQVPPSTNSTDDDPLAFLRNQEMFTQMRQMLQRNPDMLNAVLQQLGQSNPQLLQVISQNQEAFIRMINEPARPTPSGGTGTGGDPSIPRPGAIQVSREDKDAIDRLKALGFPEHLVVQAYFACDKNENLAANFLLSQNLDDE